MLAPPLPIAADVPLRHRTSMARPPLLSGWMPLSACTASCADASVPLVDRATRRRRWLSLAGVMAVAAVRIPVLSRAGTGARQRVAFCVAAGVITALGIRVDVVNPAVPWPRAERGRLVVSNHISWLDELALLIAVRTTPVAKASVRSWPLVGGLAHRLGVIFVRRDQLRSVADGVREVTGRLRRGASISVHPEGTTSCGVELGRFRPAFFQAAVDAGVPVCPVAIRYRIDQGAGTTVAGYLGGDTLRRSIARVVAARGLVIEVHLLPALEATAGDRRTLAALAEYAVAGVTEAGRSSVSVRTSPAHRPMPTSLLLSSAGRAHARSSVLHPSSLPLRFAGRGWVNGWSGRLRPVQVAGPVRDRAHHPEERRRTR